MPKRVIDGPGIWRSEKIRRIEPVWARAEFANLLPLALANGVFEADAARIWSDVYSFNRPDIKPADVQTILDALEQVKLLFRWTDADGKVWGYWIGIDKAGRLPGKSRRGKNEAIGPEPPEGALSAFLTTSMDSIGIQKLPGFGFGSGSGLGSGSGVKHSTAPAAPSVCEQAIAIWNENRGPLPELQKLTDGRKKKIRARLKTNPQFLELLKAAVQKAADTPFLRGEGKHGWRLNFDWLVKNDESATRVLEGNYDDPSTLKGDGNEHFERNCKAAGIPVQ